MIHFNGSRTVWKFRVPVANVFTLQLPSDHQILDVQAQGDDYVMWILLDPNDEVTPVRFVMFGTGYAPPSSLKGFDYVKTLQSVGGKIVVHLFRELHA